ncbi:hypothetical protein SprV_0301275500 [Sparganum proliferum]
MTLLTLAVQDVHPLLDNSRSNRLERRRTLVARELARYKVDMTGLKETRFPKQGDLKEMGAACTFFRSSSLEEERCDVGVAIPIREDIVGRLPCLPQGVNDRFMT